MDDFWKRASHQWQDSVNFILGLWLIISPWVLGYATTYPAWNAWIIGVIIAVAAAATLVAFHQWEEWLNVVLAAWLIVSPWLLGFSTMTAEVSNQVIVGIVVGVLAIWSARVEHEPRRLAT